MSMKLVESEVLEIVKTLNDFKETFESINESHDRDAFFKQIEGLRKYTTSIIDENVFKAFYHSEYFKIFSLHFTPIINYYMRAIEALESSYIQRIQFSDSTSPLEDKVKGSFMKSRFHTKVNDLQMIDFTNVKKIVMVGSGPLPDTIMFIAQNFPNVEAIIGIDNNAEAVFSGSELIRFLGLSNVTIKHADGVFFDYEEADLVYVANFVPPKNRVLDQIAKTAPNHVQIIIESPVLMGRLFFEEVIPETLNNLLKITGKRINETEFFRHEVLKIEKYPEI